MKLYRNLLMFVFFLVPAISFSQAKQFQSKAESWYSYWAIGFPSYNRPKDIIETVNHLKGHNYDLFYNVDLFGTYFPLSSSLIVGGIINLTEDFAAIEGDNFDEIAIIMIQASSSAMYFPGGRIGQGFFIRVDTGIARIRIDSGRDAEDLGDWGIGILGGIGYSFPLTDGGTRLLFAANFALRYHDTWQNDMHTFKLRVFSAGLLF